MTDWTDIHDDFTDELQSQWEKYEPEDADFAFYIEKQGYTVDDVERKEGRINKLRDKYDRGEEMIDDFSSEEEDYEEEVKIQTKKVRLSNPPNQD
ncbi:20978_t:CDS:2 [Entrophospora sp. SA101]|nr:3570_t:CDS:2 [Entrophospora sp. SA101]CAJ0746945.1 20978_t:CDS:2 [Entrophospora sp. SA101]CAJ0826999.1 10611_t:CDS:2 [Entrophospora sp. SA101]CAJ0842082.1 10739_t:CDS:2 [Entrophospora sp. SA101]